MVNRIAYIQVQQINETPSKKVVRVCSTQWAFLKMT